MKNKNLQIQKISAWINPKCIMQSENVRQKLHTVEFT